MTECTKETLVLETSVVASTIYDHQRRLCLEYRHEPASYDSCVKLVELEIDDTLNSCLKWATPSQHVKSHRVAMFPWLTDENRYLMLDEINSVLYDSIRYPILSVVGQTWKVWSTKPLGDDVILIEEQDYRITEWHRITNTPE